jgi:hypothetical protein
LSAAAQRAKAEAIPIKFLNDGDGFRKALNPSYAASVSLPAQRIERRSFFPSLPATNAKRLRKGALATKQSILLCRAMDCFAEPCHRAARCAGPVARNDGLKTLDVFAV